MSRKKMKAVKKKPVAATETQVCVYRDDPGTGIPIWNSALFARLINQKRWIECFESACKFMTYFETHHYKGFGKDDIAAINAFVTSVFMLLIQPDFTLGTQESFRLVSCGHLFASLVALSGYLTTDPALRMLISEGNLVKLTFLQNSRSNIQANAKIFFDANVELASVWYNTYMLGVGCPTDIMERNVRNHVANFDDRWIPMNHHVSCPAFTCTYMNQRDTKSFKTKLNKSLSGRMNIPFTNNPDPLSIAICTSKWHRNHAVYKSAGPLVEQLLGKYKLTLIHLGEGVPDTLVKDYFDKTYNVYFNRQGKLVIPDEILTNDFQLLYYPDIGMIDEGVWLSNQRVAPIQAVGYGHPETTGATQIDYFIGGDVEKDATDWYTEKMVLIPGLAQHPAWPTAPRKNNWQPSEKVRVNCVWGPDKYNNTLLRVLAAINMQCGGHEGHEYHFFPSPGANRYACLVPWMRDIQTILPNSVFHTDIEYYDYMEAAEQNDFLLNSYPFGGYNTIVESYYLGLPCVCLRGERFYNRAGNELNTMIGMEELNAYFVEDYIQIAAQLITDKEYLAAERAKLASIDLKAKLFQVTDKHFLNAIDHIIANHPLQTNPTLIGELYA